MINIATHNRGYYREMRKKHILRKKKIIHELGDIWYYPYEGMLSKGKIHCSCVLCRGKDSRGRHIKTLQERRSDESMKYYLKAYTAEIMKII